MNILKGFIALVRWCCSKPKKKETVTPVPISSYGIKPDPLLLVFTVAAATLTVAGNAPANYTLTANPLNLAFTVADANLTATGSTIMPVGPLNLVLTVAPATLRATARMRVSAANLAVTVAPAILRNNPRTAAGALSLAFTVSSAALITASDAPASVVAKSYQTTYAYRTRAAPTTTKNLLAYVAAGTPLPTGWAYDPGGKILYIGADFDESGWDVRGVGIYNQAAHTAIWRVSRLGQVPHLDYCVRNGSDDGTTASVMELHGCEVDGHGTHGAQSSWSTVNNFGVATFKSYDTNWINADYRHFSGKGEFYRDYFGKAGVSVTDFVNIHCEQLFLRQSLMEDCLLDGRGSALPVGSGNIQVEGGTHVYTRTIMLGARDLGADVAVQGSDNSTFTWTGCIVEPGASIDNSPTGGYLAINGTTSSSSTNSNDFASNSSINSILTA